MAPFEKIFWPLMFLEIIHIEQQDAKSTSLLAHFLPLIDICLLDGSGALYTFLALLNDGEPGCSIVC